MTELGKAWTITTLYALILLVAHTSAQAASELVLAEAGQARYAIVIAEEAAQQEQQAADELAYFLGEMTGARFPVVTDDETVGERLIVLGETSRKSLDDIPPPLRPEAWEGFVILPEDDDLYILGGQIPRGTLYGVYDFLEQELGVRFVAPQVNHVPQRTTLRVAVEARRYDPPFEYRAHHPPVQARAGYNDWMHRSRINSLAQGYGSVRRLGAMIHTFAALVPPKQYFAEQPEMFAMVDGKRTADSFCLTHPQTLRVATATARKWASQADSDPSKKWIVEIGQNDTHVYCQCTACAAIGREEGAPFSGPLIRFVNAVAREIGKDHPHVLVETFAYITSEAPPRKTRPEPNVVIWFAPILKDNGRPLNQSQKRAGPWMPGPVDKPLATKSLTYLRGWAGITRHLYIWDYPPSFADFLVPFPSLWATAENIRIFHETGATGYFPQQPNTDGTEMRYLRNYMLNQLMWRPRRDPRAVVEEFCQLYYGPEAARPILKYIDLLHDAWRKEDRFLGWGGYRDDAFITTADRVLAQATALAPTPEHRARVAEFRLPIWRLMLTQAFGNAGKVISLPEQWWYRPDHDGKDTAPQHTTTDFDRWNRVPIAELSPQAAAAGHGPGWYGARFEISETHRGPLALHVAAMQGTWDVYVDGQPVATELPSGLERYHEVNYVPLPGDLPVGSHTLMIHVRNGSGFFKLPRLQNPNFTTADPVTIVDLSQPLSPDLRTAAEGFLSASENAGITRIFYGYTLPDAYLEKLVRPKIRFLLQHGQGK